MQKITAADVAFIVRDGEKVMHDQSLMPSGYAPSAQSNGDGLLAVARKKMLLQCVIVTSADVEVRFHSSNFKGC